MSMSVVKIAEGLARAIPIGGELKSILLLRGLRTAGALIPRSRIQVTRPVFVIGTGRCGTTLCYRIFRSHQQILAFPGEANELWHPNLYPIRRFSRDAVEITRNPRRFTSVSLASWPKDQGIVIQRTFGAFQMVAPKRRLFVKSAMIVFLMPKILELFPGAQFIHLYRHPLPMIASYYKKNASILGNATGERDEETLIRQIAGYWRDCVMEIDRVDALYALSENRQLLQVRYEDLCEQSRTMLARCASFLGIDQDGFTFDVSVIRAPSFNADDYKRDPRYRAAWEIVGPLLEAKGYPLSGDRAIAAARPAT